MTAPASPSAAALAAVVCEAAPIVASALADIPHPGRARFTYHSDGVRLSCAGHVTRTAREHLFTRIEAAFDANGWATSARFEADTRIGLTFYPPWTQTLTGAPAAPNPHS
jgi:hypothetical protein